jgi:copper(I)-binding protein
VSRSRRGFAPPGRLAAAAVLTVTVVGLGPAIAACEVGNNAPTTQFHPQSDGVDTVLNGIDIRNAFVLGPRIDGTLPVGSSAGVFLALINPGTRDRLVSVTAPRTASSVMLPPGGIRLPRQTAAYLTGPAPEIVLEHLLRPLSGGDTALVTLNFQNAGSITLALPVLPRSGSYATFSPALNPAEASPTTAGSPGASRPGSSPSPSPPAGTP